MRGTSFVPALALLLALTCLPTVFGRPAAARGTRDVQALVDAAEADFRAARYEDALRGYSAALDAGGPPALRFMVGRCHQMLERWREAHDAYHTVLADPATPGHIRERTAAELAAVEARLTVGTLILHVAPFGAQVFVDGVDMGAAPLGPLTLPAGRHVVRVGVDGGRPEALTVDVEGGATMTRTVALRGGGTTSGDEEPDALAPPERSGYARGRLGLFGAFGIGDGGYALGGGVFGRYQISDLAGLGLRVAAHEFQPANGAFQEWADPGALIAVQAVLNLRIRWGGEGEVYAAIPLGLSVLDLGGAEETRCWGVATGLELGVSFSFGRSLSLFAEAGYAFDYLDGGDWGSESMHSGRVHVGFSWRL